MNIHNALEEFAKRFSPNEYVLGGGLAVYLHTGKERQTQDIDILALSDDIGTRLNGFCIDTGVRLDVVRGLEYLRSISFTPELLRRNTERLVFREQPVPCLSREALLVSKLTCLYHSEIEGSRHVLYLTVPLLRKKDVIDAHNLYERGIEDDRVIDLLAAVQHLQGINVSSFYGVARAILTDKTLPEEIVQNTYGLAKIGSYCGKNQRQSLIETAKRGLTTKDPGMIGLLVDQAYEPCRRASNPLKEFKKRIQPS